MCWMGSSKFVASAPPLSPKHESVPGLPAHTMSEVSALSEPHFVRQSESAANGIAAHLSSVGKVPPSMRPQPLTTAACVSVGAGGVHELSVRKSMGCAVVPARGVEPASVTTAAAWLGGAGAETADTEVAGLCRRGPPLLREFFPTGWS